MSFSKAKILVVEDDVSIRLTFCRILIGLGYVVDSASDGFTALSEMRRQMPDVVLSDLNMPGMSGFELLTVIRRRFPSVQVIAMSSAFSGEGVPPGVTADAFYEKGAKGFADFHQILTVMTGPERLAAGPKLSSLPPVWVPRVSNEESASQHAIVTCPECLRAFPIEFGGDGSSPIRAECVYCESEIEVEMEWSSGSESIERFARKTGAGMQSSIAVPAFT